MKDSHIGSLRTLFQWLEKLTETDSDDKDFVYVFRGHPSKSHSLIPSIYRKPEWQSNEDKIIRQIILRCPNEFRHMETAFEKLVKMQHYDLPTRLLDLTENPLVALYFACLDNTDSTNSNDGEILFFKVPKSAIKYFDSDVVSIISNIPWCPNNFEVHDRFSSDTRSFNVERNQHASKLLHNIRREKPHFDAKIAPADIQRVVCVKPIIDNPRLARQDGLFFLFGIDSTKQNPALIPDEWISRPDGKRLIIRASDKINILNQLQKVGISKEKLFPEIDMVSQFIKTNPELEPIEFRSSIPKMTKAPPIGW
ncbi:FRG domain-containing protein [Idiomarina abyssalis]|uniref:FRG domain-containing protein n=1 Tax=Idiomarina abyssalis TaxID=86102 RepID=UPI003A92194E